MRCRLVRQNAAFVNSLAGRPVRDCVPRASAVPEVPLPPAPAGVAAATAVDAADLAAATAVDAADLAAAGR